MREKYTVKQALEAHTLFRDTLVDFLTEPDSVAWQ